MISKASFCFIVTIIAGKSDKTMIKCHTIRIVRQTDGGTVMYHPGSNTLLNLERCTYIEMKM